MSSLRGLAAYIATLALAGPIVITRLAELAIPTSDMIYAGRGTDAALAHIGLGWAPWALCYVVVSGLVSGVSVMVSQFEGQGKSNQSRLVLYAGACLGLNCGVVFFALSLFSNAGFLSLGYDANLALGASQVFIAYSSAMPFFVVQIVCCLYLSAQKRPLPEMFITIAVASANIALNAYVSKVSGPNDASAIAWASGFARASGAIAMIAYVVVYLRSTFGTSNRDWAQYLKPLVQLGIPLSLSFGLESATYFLFALLAAALGVVQVAGFQSGMNTLNLIYMVSIGIGIAAGVQSGQAVGGANKAALVAETRAACVVGGLMMLAVSGFIFWQRNWIGNLYSSEPKVVNLIEACMVIAATYLVFETIQIILKMALRGMADIWVPFWIMIVSFWVVGLPLGWILAYPFEFGAKGLFVSIGVSMTLACLGNALRFHWMIKQTVRQFV